MKNCKKILAVLILAAMCVALVACGHAVPSATIEIDPQTGAGSAQFTMVVPKNGAPDVGNNFVTPNGDDGPNNTGYITSPDALLTLMQDSVPEGFTVTKNEVTNMVDHTDEFGDVDTVDEGSFDYTIAFSFTGIDDYNAKVKTWLAQKYWDAVQEAKGAAVQEAVMQDGSVTIDTWILDVICQWAFDVISTDTTGAVVDGGSGFDITYCYNMDKSSLTLKVGGQEETVRYGSEDSKLTVGSAPAPTDAPTDPKPTQPTSGEPAPTNPPTSDSPSTGLIIGIVLVVAAIAAVIVVVIIRKKK